MTTLVNNYAFPEANGPLNAGLWTIPSTTDPIVVASHQAQANSSNLNSEAVYTGAGAVANDQWVQFTLAGCVNGDYMGGILRGATGADTCYIFFVGGTGAGTTVKVARRNAGAFTLLSSTTLNVAASDVYYFEIQGLTLKVKQNGGAFIAALTFTDSGGSTIASGTPGLIGGSTAGGGVGDDISLFSMGDFATATFLPQSSTQFFQNDTVIQY